MVEADYGCVTDQHLCFAWRVRYVTFADLCLMLQPCLLMTVRDLKAAYHLVKYGGCNGMAKILVCWVTNHSRTGYVKQRFMQAAVPRVWPRGLYGRS